MQQLTYASKSFVTTDAVTEALLDLVTAIDRKEHSEAVTVPAFTEDGRRIEARMTLDASSELVAVGVDLNIEDSQATDDAVAAAIEDIRSRIRNNQVIVARPEPEELAPGPVYDDF